MRTTTTLFMLIMAVGLMMSCRKPSENERLRTAAIDYYTRLIGGDYDYCVDAIVYADSMTDDYRSQLKDLLAQYAAREKERTGGPVSVRVLSDTLMDEVGHVFLEVMYADSTNEEVMLPMIRSGEVWKVQ
ncbi:MAG: hypothetical protein NC388_10720 [Clostridium sp.]|nr:hypothetical protein [Clostridium sp.]